MGLGLGLGIWWPTQTSIIPGLLKALCARATYCENKTCTTAILEEIAAVRYTAPVLPIGLLADYPGASAAYSLRNLIDTTTNVVRVRRSSDNTEQDFTSEEITDGTLTTFTGANDGFVTTWYDQSGNVKNLSTPTASVQPKIVNTGVVNINNGKPYLEYLGNFSGLSGLIASSVGLTFNNASLFATYNSNDVNPGCLLGTFEGGGDYVGLYQVGSNSTPTGNAGSPNYYTDSVIVSPVTRDEIYNTFVNNQDVLISVLNIDFTQTVNWNTGSISPYMYRTNNYVSDSKAKEFIIYNSDQTANRDGIETNINTEYNIY